MRTQVMDQEYPAVTVDIDRSLIRDFAEAIGDPNPLWSDEATARRTRHGGVIAPPTFPRVVAFLAADNSGPRWQLPGTVQVDGGTEWELFEPIRPGDRIAVKRRVQDLFERDGRNGPLIFIKVRTDFANQFGTTVCVQHATAIRYSPRTEANHEPLIAEHRNPPPHGCPVQRSDARVDVASLEAGAPLPTLIKCPTTRDLVRYAGASKDYSEIHYDDAFARRVGLRGVIVHGALKAAYLGQLITDWIGDLGRLTRLECQHRGMNRPGEVLSCRGKVTRVHERDGTRVAECEIWIEDSQGERSAPGLATVEFPDRPPTNTSRRSDLPTAPRPT